MGYGFPGGDAADAGICQSWRWGYVLQFKGLRSGEDRGTTMVDCGELRTVLHSLSPMFDLLR